MWQVYLTCALVGGTLFILQLLLSIMGGDHDYSHDGIGGDAGHHDAHFWGVFSLRAIVAGVTAFGLGGLLAKSMGATTIVSAPTAIASFFAAAFLVAILLRMMSKLSADGTTQIQNAVGQNAVVYVSIPGDKNGVGKVHLELQHRTIEIEAVTYGNALETGMRVIVTSVIGTNMVEVIAAPEMAHAYSDSQASKQ